MPEASDYYGGKWHVPDKPDKVLERVLELNEQHKRK